MEWTYDTMRGIFQFRDKYGSQVGSVTPTATGVLAQYKGRWFPREYKTEASAKRAVEKAHEQNTKE